MREEKNAAADDGRTIADMNVEGMPWYVPGDENRALHRENENSGYSPSPMSDEELKSYRWAAVKAGLFVALVFGGAFALFLAFCDFVWFR